MWYSSFWLERLKKHLNLTILVSKFVPWDLEGCRTSDLEGRQHGTLRGASRTSRGGAIRPRGAVPLNLDGRRTIPQGAPPWDLEGRRMDFEGGAMGPWWAAHGPRGALPWDLVGRHTDLEGQDQGPRCSTPRGPKGTKFETKMFKVRWFLVPSDQNELYHTPLLSEIWGLGDRNFLWDNTLN